MKKRTKIALTAIPILGTIGGVGAYIAIHMNQSQKTKAEVSGNKYVPPDTITDTSGEATTDLVDKFQVFPELNQQKFYKYIRIINGKPVMNKDFIAQVANYVIKNMQISDGKIEWGYSINDEKTNLDITFNWVSGNQGRIFKKTYTLNLTKSV